MRVSEDFTVNEYLIAWKRREIDTIDINHE